jgi:hypothetical protein
MVIRDPWTVKAGCAGIHVIVMFGAARDKLAAWLSVESLYVSYRIDIYVQ